MHAAVLTVLLAISSDPALLAPGPEELESAFVRAEQLLTRAHAIETALARLHNRWAELDPKKPCEEAEPRSIAARSRVFGMALRDAAQSTRAQKHRLDRIYAAPTLSALLDAKLKRRHDQLERAIATLERRFSELRAWQHAEIERTTKRCGKLLVEVTAGLQTRAPCAGTECTRPIAIIGIGEGKICPIDARAGGVFVLPDGQACYGKERCDCVPAPQLPGAVLGP